jgi:GntR family transcriptional repressor for pyruvate dehydrogenase complex
LQALGIAEIKMGKGGGARVARGNPRLFAEALAVQLDLTGVTAAEIMDAQRAIECLAAELAAENATDADIARLRQIVVDSEASLNDAAQTTELGAAFHLAVAEASHNRVLVVQLISLQHVSWPRRNPTMNPKVAKRILDVHKELLALIEVRDPDGARKLMDGHVKMIRARRVSESKSTSQPFVPAKAGTQSGQGKRLLGSRLRGSERVASAEPKLTRLKNFNCC